MKRLLMTLFLVLLIMSTPVFASTPASSSSAGGWTVAKTRHSFLSSGQKKIFDKAVKNLGGVSFKPVALLARQTVNGTNYLFLCQGTTVTKKPVKSWYVLTAWKSLKNKVTLLSIKKINLSSIKTNKKPRKSIIDGGLQIVPVKKKPGALSGAAKKIFRKGTKNYKKYDLRPIALLGMRIVSRANYKYLCYGTGNGINSASKDLFVVDIYKNVKGKCRVKSCKPMKLEEYKEIDDGKDVSASDYPYEAKITSPNGKSVDFKKQAGSWSSNVDGVDRVPHGTVVTVLSTFNHWCHCQLSNGKTGWVMEQYINKSR